MRIRLLSDLHHEWMNSKEEKAQTYFQYNGEDVLVLAGDIGGSSSMVYDTIQHFKHIGFPEVVYVAGNHEYYGTDIRTFNATMAAKAMRDDTTHFLNPGSVVIGDVTFIGGTLWTNFRNDMMLAFDAQRGISDFSMIRGFLPSHCIHMFERDSHYIKHMYESRKTEKVVIVTHFLPAIQCISERYRGPENTLNGYFANALDDWIYELDNTTWLFGHTHDSIDVTIGTTRCVSNPFGYWANSINQDFKDNFVIEV